jgi:hypothetical protein
MVAIAFFLVHVCGYHCRELGIHFGQYTPHSGILLNYSLRHAFMIEREIGAAEYLLQCVRKWTMTDIVQQCCRDRTKQPFLLWLFVGVPYDAVEHLTRQVRRAHAVGKPRVLRAVEDQVRKSVLANVPQALKLRAVNQSSNQPSDALL